MKRYRTLFIGHVTVDANTDCEGRTDTDPGGAVIYASAAAGLLGHSVGVVTKLAKEDSARLKAFKIPADDIYVSWSAHSTTMTNKYFTPDKDRRLSTCISVGEPFTQADMPDGRAGADVYDLAGLVYGDFSSDFIRETAKRGRTALDVQAMLRHVNSDGSLFFEDWADKKELLPLISYLKTDAAEAEILTGQNDRYRAAHILHDWGAGEVLITHNDEVIAYDGRELLACPLRSRSLIGRTGRGDTTFSVYINERQEHDMALSLLTAAAAVSLKMEKLGAFSAGRAELNEYIAAIYPDFDPLTGRKRAA